LLPTVTETDLPDCSLLDSIDECSEFCSSYMPSNGNSVAPCIDDLCVSLMYMNSRHEIEKLGRPLTLFINYISLYMLALTLPSYALYAHTGLM